MVAYDATLRNIELVTDKRVSVSADFRKRVTAACFCCAVSVEGSSSEADPSSPHLHVRPNIHRGGRR